MTAADFIILGLVLALAAFSALRLSARKKTPGCGGCCASCRGCDAGTGEGPAS